MDALLTFFLTAVAAIGAWFLRGWFTPAKRAERYDLASKMLDVRQKLVATGYDPTQIEQFVTTLESDPTGERASSALKAIGAISETPFGGSPPSILDTTAAMGVRAEAELRVLDAKIERVLLDIEILSEHRFARSGYDAKTFDALSATRPGGRMRLVVRRMPSTWLNSITGARHLLRTR